MIQAASWAESRALEPLLRALQMLVACYPQLASGVLRALVAEGKRFATTREGAQLQHHLHGAGWVERGRILWEACGLDELVGEPGASAGSGRPLGEGIHCLRDELAHADLEQILSSLMFGGIPIAYDDSSRTGSGIRSPQ